MASDASEKKLLDEFKKNSDLRDNLARAKRDVENHTDYLLKSDEAIQKYTNQCKCEGISHVVGNVQNTLFIIWDGLKYQVCTPKIIK